MSRSIEMNKGNINEIVEKLMSEHKEIDSKDMLIKILGSFGEIIGDTYIILNNEHWEEYNSYYNVSSFIDMYFGCKDSFDVICYSMKEAVCNMNKHEVADLLGLKFREIVEE
jgi:hypothetical protein